MTSLQQGGEAENGRAGKRPKVTMACDQCRARKIRCDGERPVCQPCSSRRGSTIDCSYGERNVRGPSKAQRQTSGSQSRDCEIESRGGRSDPSQNRTSPQQNHQQSRVANASQPDGLGAMMELGDGAHSTREFEDSSAASFMNQLRAAVDQRLSLDLPRTSGSKSTSEAPKSRLTKQGRSRESQQSLDYVLPPRKRADTLVETYWQLVDPLYPFLERDYFDRTYQCLWTGVALDCDEATFACLLNAMFSLACALDTSSSPDNRQALADGFYARANHFISLDLLQAESLLTVQCFLILGQYLQSTNEPRQCWTIIGLAIRTAQALGLHLPSTSAHAQNAQEADLLRRVWHGCILMDRALSMTLGRPSMITTQAANSVRKPLSHKDNRACKCTGDDSQSKRVLPDRHLFIESLRLYEILNDILLSIYTPLSNEAKDSDRDSIYLGEPSASRLSAILRIDQDMRLYVRQLPRHLSFCPMDSRTTMHGRQKNVLWLRYHHIRILLLRSALTLPCVARQGYSGHTDTILPSRVALQCAILCVETSIKVIDFFLENTKNVQSVGPELDDILPAWWYNVFYIYTAATVLIAARLSDAIMAGVSDERLTNTLESAMHLLKMFSGHSKNATRCVAALEILLDKLPLRTDQRSRREYQYARPDQGQPESPLNPPLALFAEDSSSAMKYAAMPPPADPEHFPNFSLDWSDMSWLSSVPMDFILS